MYVVCCLCGHFDLFAAIYSFGLICGQFILGRNFGYYALIDCSGRDAVCCNVLQRVAVAVVCRSMLQCVVMCCGGVQCIAVCCTITYSMGVWLFVCVCVYVCLFVSVCVGICVCFYDYSCV